MKKNKLVGLVIMMIIISGCRAQEVIVESENGDELIQEEVIDIELLVEGPITEKDEVMNSMYPLMASISEADLWLYGDGDGSILKHRELVQQFDWHPSPTPRYVLPRITLRDVDQDGLEDIICILYVGSGTGISVEELRVLKQEQNGVYTDYGHDTYIDVLASKMVSHIDRETDSIDIELDGVDYKLPLSEEQLEYEVTDFILNEQVVAYDVDEDIRVSVALGALTEALPTILYTDYKVSASIVFEKGTFELKDISLVTVER